MQLSNSVVLVTGANRGIGRVFVAELLKRGASKIYVPARDTTSLKALLKDGDRAISAPDIDHARHEMEVNYFGTLALTRAFAPVLARNGGGALLNMLSMLSLISLPAAATYSASKAASLSLTRSVRAELSAQGTQVVGVLAVQTETEMGAKLPEPRMTPQEVVTDALDAIRAGTNDEIVAGDQSRGIHAAFTADPKGLQARMSTRLPQRA